VIFFKFSVEFSELVESGLLSLLKIASIENLSLDFCGGDDDNDTGVVCAVTGVTYGNVGIDLYADDKNAGCTDKSYDFKEYARGQKELAMANI
jgi:hypothetical protein